MSEIGPSRHIAVPHDLGRFVSKADMAGLATGSTPVANDPNRKSSFDRYAYRSLLQSHTPRFASAFCSIPVSSATLSRATSRTSCYTGSPCETIRQRTPKRAPRSLLQAALCPGIVMCMYVDLSAALGSAADQGAHGKRAFQWTEGRFVEMAVEAQGE